MGPDRLEVAAPPYRGWGEQLTFLMKENLPASYSYTGGEYRRNM